MSKVLLAPNGNLIEAIPLYSRAESTQLDHFVGYKVYVSSDKPEAYMLFYEEECLALFSINQLGALPLEDLGEL